MDRIMDKLCKFEKEPNEEDDKVEVSDNYLSHLNNLYTKVFPFLDDLHKEMQNTLKDQLPEIIKDKEDKLDKILTSTELYYKTDEDPEDKSNQSKVKCDSLLNLIDDFSKLGRLDERKVPGKLDPRRIPDPNARRAQKGKDNL